MWNDCLPVVDRESQGKGGAVIGQRYYRKVIRIRGEDSPNVRYARAQIAAGIEPTDEIIVPGVLRWSDYCKRRATWDVVRQTIGLDGEFYEGAQLLLFPPDWLNRAEEIARILAGKPRKAKAIGIDPAEGGDKTAMASVDEFGLIKLVSRKTPNTDDIPREVLAFGREQQVEPVNWVFDRGGGGRQHADRIRKMGREFRGVRTVAFGEPVALPIRRGLQPIEARVDVKEERYEYVNLRAKMYGELSERMDPALFSDGFGIPSEYCFPIPEGKCLREQLAPLPKLYDNEGRMWLPSKGTVTDRMKEEKIKTLLQIIGHSPDEADALVLAVHGMIHKKRVVIAGAVG